MAGGGAACIDDSALERGRGRAGERKLAVERMRGGEASGGERTRASDGEDAPQRRRDGNGRSARRAAREGGSLRERLRNRRRIKDAGR